MKALSIRQPWAELIVRGAKDVENRTWTTQYRGPLLIHAPYLVSRLTPQLISLCQDAGIDPWTLDGLGIGGIVGIADLVECVEESDSEWFGGPYGFVLAHARRLPFRPCPGRLGLFDLACPEDEFNRQSAAADKNAKNEPNAPQGRSPLYGRSRT